MASQHPNDSSDKLQAELTNNEVLSIAASQASDEQRTLWQNVKKYRKVVGYTFCITSAILLYGYDNVVVGTVSAMPIFQKDFGVENPDWHKGSRSDPRYILPSDWLALWNVSSPIGAMIGSILGAWLQDRIGRRRALAISSFLSAVAVAIMYVSYLPADVNGRRGCFFAGKFAQGAAIGAVMAAAQTYMSEILPPSLRGPGMAFFPVFTLLGQLTGALVIYGALDQTNGYAVVFGSQWPFSFVPIIISFIVPESPTWLVRKRLVDQALVAQTRLDPPGTDSKGTVNKIQADIEHEESNSGATFMECFHKRNFRRTFIVMWANSMPAIFGLQLLAKASYFLQLVGMKPNTSIIFLILGIVLGLLANAASIYVMSRIGRRPLMISTLLIASLLWMTMGIANCFKLVPAVTNWTAAAMMITIVVCGVGVWPCSFAVAAETSSLQLRSKAQGIGWTISAFTSAVAGIALPYIFNPDQGNLRGKVGFTYVGSCLLAAIITWFIVPEMKGRTVADIDRMFELNLPARQFKNWKASERQGSGDQQPWV
ncbi:MFS general substrate transporter [Aaosphaeria arxii CBS 175.79]|uniref:MFS general substrate transporter n=1 Tax=Aaosphaeria arxii CBS 175.79 TaxID=1450172 RepID=A0A6A5XPN1_9PLEO|nr:MFS general substrate transporter [Aaosphaeria arxii CBS 175.79]KAF2015208.1 MFS general substrate transporter [Aaosphaeria arxii CBS 175.79]